MTWTVQMRAFCAHAVMSQMAFRSRAPGDQCGAGEGVTPRPAGSKGWPRCDGRAACDYLRVPCTVLIVDDHDGFRSSARALLEAEGFAVVGEAEDAASA